MIRRSYEGPLRGALGDVQRDIVACRKCPRLVEHRERKALQERRKSFATWDYWGAPVPSYGDPGARLLIVGLAPGSHGANRTGRMFTGDPTADFLVQALYRAGFSNQPTSQHRNDGLKLVDAYEVAVARCAPPNDKPTTTELSNCSAFLAAELGLLTKVRAILALGRVGFEHFLRALSTTTGVRLRADFKHGAVYSLGGGLPTLFCSYHPSPRNTNTGRLTEALLDDVLSKVRSFIDDE